MTAMGDTMGAKAGGAVLSTRQKYKDGSMSSLAVAAGIAFGVTAIGNTAAPPAPTEADTWRFNDNAGPTMAVRRRLATGAANALDTHWSPSSSTAPAYDRQKSFGLLLGAADIRVDVARQTFKRLTGEMPASSQTGPRARWTSRVSIAPWSSGAQGVDIGIGVSGQSMRFASIDDGRLYRSRLADVRLTWHSRHFQVGSSLFHVVAARSARLDGLQSLAIVAGEPVREDGIGTSLVWAPAGLQRAKSWRLRLDGSDAIINRSDPIAARLYAGRDLLCRLVVARSF